MARRRIAMFYDVTDRVLRDSTGAELAIAAIPYIYYRGRPIINLTLVTNAALAAYTGLASDNTYEGAVDKTFISASLMCKTLNSGINVAGDWGDAGTADIAAGEVSIKLNADTTGFQTKIGTLEELAGTRFELKVKASDNSIDAIYRMQLRALGIMNDSGAVPSAVSDNWVPFTDAATGKQCVWLLNDDGEVLETMCPMGVEGVE